MTDEQLPIPANAFGSRLQESYDGAKLFKPSVHYRRETVVLLRIAPSRMRDGAILFGFMLSRMREMPNLFGLMVSRLRDGAKLFGFKVSRKREGALLFFGAGTVCFWWD